MLLCLLFHALSFRVTHVNEWFNPFICCYDIKAKALSNISLGVSDNPLNVMVFTFPHTKFAADLT